MPNTIRGDGRCDMATVYDDLLTQYKPRPIYSDQSYRKALAAVERLMHLAHPKPTAAQRDMIDLLATMIQRYETERFGELTATPGECLEMMMENRKVTQIELSKATGVPQSTIANVIAGRRAISKANARKLAEFFRVGVGVFIG